MEPRSERRRKERAGKPPSPVFGTTGLIAAGLLGAGVTIIIVGIVLLAGGDDDDGDGAQVQDPTGTGPIAIVSPESEDEIALEALARQTIEALPNDRWGELYPKFTSEFQERCAEADFVAAGERDAAEQGGNLTLIRYVGVQEYDVSGESARLVIVGRLEGASEYTIGANFEKVEGDWLIAPVAASTGCDAFERLSG